MSFAAPADVIAELEKRKKNNPDFAEAFNKNVTQMFVDAIADRLGRGGSAFLYIFGRNNSGKSITAQTIVLDIIIRIFMLLGYLMDPWQDIAVTRDNSQSLEAFKLRMQSERHDIPIIVIQDENEELSGHDRIYAMKNMTSELKAMRSTHYCYILITLDHYKQALKMENKITSLGFIILETIDQNIDFSTVDAEIGEPLKGTNRLVFHSLEGPHGMIYVNHHGNKKFLIWYGDLKQKANERLLAAGGAAAAQSDLMLLSRKIHDETMLQIEDTGNLSAADFRAIARKMEGENKIYGTSEKLKDASQLAWRILYLGPKVPPQVEVPRVENPTFAANGGNLAPEPEKLPEEDNAALREIAYEELSKRFPKAKPSIIEALREFDYPIDREEDAEHWNAAEVKAALHSDLRPDSLRKTYRQYKVGINSVREKIGVRFVQHLIEKTPNFPAQILQGSGPGERDLSFMKDGAMVASANVKHLAADRREALERSLNLAPEFQDDVNYGILLLTKPLQVKVYRNGEHKQVLDQGSVRDLGWTGFVEDLRKEAEKATEVKAIDEGQDDSQTA